MASNDLEAELAVAWQTLTAETGATVARLRAALEQERVALESSNVMLLDAATESKLAAMRRIEALDMERAQLQQTCSRYRPTAAWRSIAADLRACKRFNEANGSIVDQRISHVRRALAVLRGRGDVATELYDAAGTVSASRGQHDFART